MSAFNDDADNDDAYDGAVAALSFSEKWEPAFQRANDGQQKTSDHSYAAGETFEMLLSISRV
jgi:hypothetical protein